MSEIVDRLNEKYDGKLFDPECFYSLEEDEGYKEDARSFRYVNDSDSEIMYDCHVILDEECRFVEIEEGTAQELISDDATTCLYEDSDWALESMYEIIEEDLDGACVTDYLSEMKEDCCGWILDLNKLPQLVYQSTDSFQMRLFLYEVESAGGVYKAPVRIDEKNVLLDVCIAEEYDREGNQTDGIAFGFENLYKDLWDAINEAKIEFDTSLLG